MPIAFPGLPQPVRLGLAGGPLIVALVLGRIGRIGRLVCHMPVNANLAFREFGIALFFAAVGLAAGPKFFASVFSSNGLLWLAGCITIVPLLLAGLFARAVPHSVTDPPALAFATSIAKSDAPTVAYATVYPLSMLLRILCAQVLALALFR
jgi:putative transport protein